MNYIVTMPRNENGETASEHANLVVDESKGLVPDRVEVERFVDAHMRPGEVHEVRIPHFRSGQWVNAAGWFDDPAAVVDAVHDLTGADADGIYISLNPVDPQLLNECPNELH